MTHLLDTDACIGILRQHPGMVARLSRLSPNDCGVSEVTGYELLCGAGKSQDPAIERAKVERFLSVLIELPFDRAGAEAASRIRVDLEKRGMVIGPYDLLIAGQALASQLTLVTNNLGEFQRVAGVRLETWP